MCKLPVKLQDVQKRWEEWKKLGNMQGRGMPPPPITPGRRASEGMIGKLSDLSFDGRSKGEI